MKEELRAIDAANTARMTRQALPRVTIVLVEGGDDQAFLQKFSDRDACRSVVAHGRPHVVDALNILRKDGFLGVVAMLDADFDRILHHVPHDPDIVQTDTHDVEMLMVASPALNNVLLEYATVEGVADVATRGGGTVLGALLRPASLVGRLRLYSYLENLSFCFDGLDFTRFISDKSLSVDQTSLLRAIQEQSRIGVIDEQSFLGVLADENYGRFDMHHLCCGHDVVLILAIALRRLLGKNNAADVMPVRLERALRLAYERTFFVATTLFREIREWEGRNPPWRVLDASLR